MTLEDRWLNELKRGFGAFLRYSRACHLATILRAGGQSVAAAEDSLMSLGD